MNLVVIQKATAATTVFLDILALAVLLLFLFLLLLLLDKFGLGRFRINLFFRLAFLNRNSLLLTFLFLIVS